MNRYAVVALALAVSACAPSAPDSSDKTPRTAEATTPRAPAEAPRPNTAKPRFADRVWRVESSSSVAPGTLYTFLSDGTLVIDAQQSTIAYGRWTYENGALVMIEEGIAYPTDVVALDDTSFSIRSHNPGEPVDIKLVAATDVPLPKPPSK